MSTTCTRTVFAERGTKLSCWCTHVGSWLLGPFSVWILFCRAAPTVDLRLDDDEVFFWVHRGIPKWKDNRHSPTWKCAVLVSGQAFECHVQIDEDSACLKSTMFPASLLVVRCGMSKVNYAENSPVYLWSHACCGATNSKFAAVSCADIWIWHPIRWAPLPGNSLVACGRPKQSSGLEAVFWIHL